MAEPVAVAETVKTYASIKDILADGAAEVEYAVIKGFKAGTQFRIGSVSAGDMMDWGDAKTAEEKKAAGLRLIRKSLVDDAGTRYAMQLTEKDFIAAFRSVRHKEAERVVKEILDLNGIVVKGKKDEENEAKND